MGPVVLLSKDDDVTWLLSQERKGNLVAEILPHWRKLLGEESIFCQNTIPHKRLRKVFEPAFSPRAIQDYVKLIDDTTVDMLKQWHDSTSASTSTTSTGSASNNNANENENEDKKMFCESKQWALLALKLFYVCAFPEKLTDDNVNTLNEHFQTWSKGFSAMIPLEIPGTTLSRALDAKKQLFDLIQSMVDDFKNENPSDSDTGNNSLLGRMCYGVDDEGKTLTDEQLTTNIMFILFAGHDTTKGSFCAFTHYLKENPRVQKLLEEEVQTFSEPLDISELKAAPILNAFLAEVWRLMPPLDAHLTKAVKELRYKDYVIPKNVICAVDIQAHHVMDEDRYPDATSFRLERWLPRDHPLHDPKYFADGVDYNVMSVKYRTFNAGAHMCLGAHFAKLEARIVLTRLLQGYDFEIFHRPMLKFPFRQHVNDFKLTKKGNGGGGGNRKGNKLD